MLPGVQNSGEKQPDKFVIRIPLVFVQTGGGTFSQQAGVYRGEASGESPMMNHSGCLDLNGMHSVCTSLVFPLLGESLYALSRTSLAAT